MKKTVDTRPIHMLRRGKRVTPVCNKHAKPRLRFTRDSGQTTCFKCLDAMGLGS